MKEWSLVGAGHKKELTTMLKAIVVEIRHSQSPAKAINRAIKKLEKFFARTEVRGAISVTNHRRVEFNLCFPEQIENGLSFYFFEGEINARSGAIKLFSSRPLQISTHALQRLLERLSARSNVAALDEIYTSLQLAGAWNAAGIESEARCWPIPSRNGLFVATPNNDSSSELLITWMQGDQLSKKWGIVYENIKKLQLHHPESLRATKYLRQFIESFPWMLKEHVPGVDMETLAWEKNQSQVEITTLSAESNDGKKGSLVVNGKPSASYVPGLNYVDGPPPFKWHSQHQGVVVQRRDSSSVIVSLQNGYFGKLVLSRIQEDEALCREVRDINVGDTVDVEVVKILRFKNEGAYSILLATTEEREASWLKIMERYPIGSNIKCQVSSTTNDIVFTIIDDDVVGFINRKRLDWYITFQHVPNEDMVGMRLELLVQGYNSKYRQVVLDVPAFYGMGGEIGDVCDVQIISLVKEGFIVGAQDGTTGYLPCKEVSWLEDEQRNMQSHVVGDVVKVAIVKITKNNQRVIFSKRALIQHPLDDPTTRPTRNVKYTGVVTKVVNFGYFIRLQNGVSGLLHTLSVPVSSTFRIGDDIFVYVSEIDLDKKRLSFSLIPSEVA